MSANPLDERQVEFTLATLRWVSVLILLGMIVYRLGNVVGLLEQLLAK